LFFGISAKSKRENKNSVVKLKALNLYKFILAGSDPDTFGIIELNFPIYIWIDSPELVLTAGSVGCQA
jgi:hypothetical protein